jgi:hypothetical protein
MEHRSDRGSSRDESHDRDDYPRSPSNHQPPSHKPSGQTPSGHQAPNHQAPNHQAPNHQPPNYHPADYSQNRPDSYDDRPYPAHRPEPRPNPWDQPDYGQHPRPNPAPDRGPHRAPDQSQKRANDRPDHWPESWFAGPAYPTTPDPRLSPRPDLNPDHPFPPPRDPGPIPRWESRPPEPGSDRYPPEDDRWHYGTAAELGRPNPRNAGSFQPLSRQSSDSTGDRADELQPNVPAGLLNLWGWLSRGLAGRGLAAWVIGSVILAGLVLLLDPSRVISRWSGGDNSQCQQVVQTQAVLSREQLVKLLAIPERSAKSKIRQVLREPYCYLSSLKIRSGALSQREAYPLSFDTNLWLVILYEGEEYAGYSFSPR